MIRGKKEGRDSLSSTLVPGMMASSVVALFGATMVSVFACAVLIRWSVVEPALVGWGGRGNAERKEGRWSAKLHVEDNISKRKHACSITSSSLVCIITHKH